MSGASRRAGGLGVGAMAVANVILGTSSLFWRELGAVSPATLLGHRILVSLVTLGIALVVLGRVRAALETAADTRLLLIHLAAAVLVCANWLAFIWGSIHGRVIETGLGYLLAPALTIALGAAVLRERLGRVRAAALGTCLLGIVLLITRSSELEWWVYVTIGTTWGTYSFLKKLTTADPVTGLALETALLALGVGVAVAVSSYSLDPGPAADTTDVVLLALCGLVSVTPLWLIAYGAKKVTLTTAGFMQYVLPTTQLVVALVCYGQRPSGNTLLCFGVVWLALVSIVAESAVRARGKRLRRPPEAAPAEHRQNLPDRQEGSRLS
ncbi:EamA family transporter [Streptomyces sp. CRN 30]|uniref:EamA family transporter n=1 Tax=Streptomyces sp. CRN 30 TaxID=3075613 RepID=UPI002A7EACC2|nr:EamA family transporter [Streptomyces sp. CRN 30]